MDNSQISAKQKRYQEWRKFIENPSVPEVLKKDLEVSLNEYGKLIVQIWDSGTLTHDDDQKLKNIERELEMLNESVRLQGARTMGREFDE